METTPSNTFTSHTDRISAKELSTLLKVSGSLASTMDLAEVLRISIESAAELLELGMLEYRKSMRAIATGFDTGEWPSPITDDYTDELNDFDLRRLEALRLA